MSGPSRLHSRRERLDSSLRAPLPGVNERARHITAPTYHGTNSFWPYPCRSLLVRSPEQVASIRSNKRRPVSSTDALPSAMSPALRSMSSSCLIHSGVLVESFSDGEGAQPYADPRPVVNQMRFAPPATWPVADTGSYPGVSM